MAPKRGKGTSLGYHYLNTYQDCPRRWWFIYGARLTPQVKSPALSFGSAIHAAREAYYLGGRDPDMLIEGFKGGMEAEKDTYQPDAYESDMSRGMAMLATWLKTWHTGDIERYKVLEVEVEHSVPLPPYTLTIRPDLVMLDTHTGEVHAWDCKTTSWSVGQAFSQVEAQDQATAYIWGLRKVHPEWRVQGLAVDVLYNRGQVFKAERPGIVYRTEGDLREWEYEATGILADLSGKMEAAQGGGYPLRHLFPRNGSYCARYSCQFSDICRQPVDPNDPPIGFTQEVEDGKE